MSHQYVSATRNGLLAVVKSTGNEFAHGVLNICGAVSCTALDEDCTDPSQIDIHNHISSIARQLKAEDVVTRMIVDVGPCDTRRENSAVNVELSLLQRLALVANVVAKAGLAGDAIAGVSATFSGPLNDEGWEELRRGLDLLRRVVLMKKKT
jgi:3-deoxy-D-arabino-heptulosonate 7-phosphate (DAHP) synthase